jgi:hypothetical protein
MFGHVDSGSGITENLFVFPFGKTSIIKVFLSNGTVIHLFIAAITHIGGTNKPCAAFLNKVLTGLVTGRTGSTFNSTENNLSTDIRFAAMIAMDTEVVGIIKGAFMIPVANSSGANLLRYSGWILADKAGNIFEGLSVI